ncbi:hypothetical protein C2U32_19120 (plasmid) [Acinetobacter baumannii]|nr:hypothetical protein C2U32_19120 [Acinetobacter baumannii]
MKIISLKKLLQIGLCNKAHRVLNCLHYLQWHLPNALFNIILLPNYKLYIYLVIYISISLYYYITILKVTYKTI